MINFGALYDDREAAYQERERKGEPHPICPHCEDYAEETGDTGEIDPPLITCWCGVCLKHHHNDYSHEPLNEPETVP